MSFTTLKITSLYITVSAILPTTSSKDSDFCGTPILEFTQESCKNGLGFDQFQVQSSKKINWKKPLNGKIRFKLGGNSGKWKMPLLIVCRNWFCLLFVTFSLSFIFGLVKKFMDWSNIVWTWIKKHSSIVKNMFWSLKIFLAQIYFFGLVEGQAFFAQIDTRNYTYFVSKIENCSDLLWDFI